MTLIVPQEVRVQAVFLKAHLKLMAAGMRHSQVTPTQMLAKAGAITGKKYKRGQFDLARKDLIEWLEANQ